MKWIKVSQASIWHSLAIFATMHVNRPSALLNLLCHFKVSTKCVGPASFKHTQGYQASATEQWRDGLFIDSDTQALNEMEMSVTR